METVKTGAAGLVDERLPTPLYHQIYLVLRDKILSTDYEVDSVLPSEQETARRRDRILRRLLQAPPQPRPKRNRGSGKPTRNRGKRASVGKREPSA